MDQFFANVPAEKTVKNLKAIVCPHAGYIYSGQVAAYSYQALKNNRKDVPKTFVILAPSHYEYFEGVSV
jgi:AmmeMemoRadiSam system protein B